MTQAIAVVPVKEIVTTQDLDVLRRSKFKGFEDHEIAYCARVSNTLALSPLLNQVHFVKRKNKDGSYAIAAQVGIDGFRLAAERTKTYAGSDDIVFEYGLDKKKPIKATATVYKMIGGQRCPFTASARWEEFYNPIGGMWDRLPHQMLGKCAEAQALRKAFPAELSNLYTPEEMDQAERPNKAQMVQAQIVGEKETPSEVDESPEHEEEPPTDGCPACGSSNVMESRYVEGQMYCKACKHKYPKESA